MGLNAPKNMRASEFVSFMGKIKKYEEMLHCLREICDKEQTYQVLLVALFKSIGPESHHHHNNHRRFSKCLFIINLSLRSIHRCHYWFSQPRHVRTPLLCAKRWNSAKRSSAETNHKQGYTKRHVTKYTKNDVINIYIYTLTCKYICKDIQTVWPTAMYIYMYEL